MIRLGIHGVAGRMGQAIVGLAASPSFRDRVKVVAAVERPGGAEVGKELNVVAGDTAVRVADHLDALAGANVIIDFSVPESTVRLADWCVGAGVALVSGTTGLSPEQKEALATAAREVPLLSAPNMSIGVNLLFHLAGTAARILGDSADPEITEIHHHHKRDAPSGTAQRLKEVVLAALGRGESDVIYGRHGANAPRLGREVGVHTLRGGDVVGEHTVFFFCAGERIELTHRASSRDTFAAGALRAALFLHGKPPGAYSMQDVLELGR